MPEQSPQDTELGKVITFYSFKGGTGRTMALANTACLLAQQRAAANPGKGVLVIDWDLEAPGLHRFFRSSLENFISANGSDAEVNQRPGLIDLFIELDQASRKCEVTGKNQPEAMVDQMLRDLDLETFILKTDRPCLSLLKAGRFDGKYASRVNSFQWEELHQRSPLLIPAFAEYLSKRYDYVLIDSRTGLTDISGISTMLMPEKLVIVFTPNRQSIYGVRDLIREAAHYRTNKSDDSRPLIVFPLASRIDTSEPNLLEYWRYGFERKKDFPKYEDTMDFEGYQPLFQKLFEEVYELQNCDLEAYFQEVQIQYVPYYAYGENIAVLRQPTGDRLSLTASYHNVVDWLVNRPVPWKQGADQKTKPAPDAPEKIAEAAFQRLTVQKQEATQRLFTRLVRIAEREEGGENTRQRVKLDELAPGERDVLPELAEVNLINITDDGPGNEKTVEASQEAIIRQWPRLKTWIDSDRQFLIWRQSLRIRIAKTAADDERKGAGLLSGRALDVAKQYLEERSDDLNELEKSHIQDSIQFELALKKSQRYQWLFYGGLVLLFGLVVFISWWRQQSNTSDTVAAYVTLAQNYSANGNFELAQDYYDRAIFLNDKLAEAYYGRGVARYNIAERRGDPKFYNDAIEDFNKAIDLNSTYGEAYNKRGVVYQKVGKLDDAIRDFETAITHNPEIVEAYINLANGYRRRGDSDKALELYANAISRKPDMAEGYNGRGLVYAQRGDHTNAIKEFGKAIELKSNFAEAYLNRGKSFRARNDLSLAISDFTNAITFDSNLIEAYFWRGNSYLATNDNRTLGDYRFFVAKWKPTSAEDYFYLGSAYNGLGEYDRAIEAFNKAIELDPNKAEPYFQRGISFHKKGNEGSAEGDFQKALDLMRDAEKESRARSELQELGIELRTPPSKANVGLYYEDTNDADLVNSIRAELNRKGFPANVMPPAARESITGIKYFHREDKENANQVHKIVEELISTNGRPSVDLTPKLHGRFARNKPVPVGTIEVWIPALR